MALSPSLAISPTSSSNGSPASDVPRTPVSPNTPSSQLPHPTKISSSGSAANTTATTAPANQTKRKPSRRANTAERRATHNAVERARRETLNGRFLDLAALLPNLTQIRRPSKSSIVNTSIAYVQASRRHRLLASRELRLLKIESDGLRQELNEWRDQAGLPRSEEPVRGDGFSMVISGELEAITSVVEEEEDEENQTYGSCGGDGDDFGGVVDGMNVSNSNPFAHNPPPTIGGTVHLTHVAPHSSHGPMVASNPPAVAFENPTIATMYEPTQSPQYGSQFIHHQPVQPEDDKWNIHFSAIACTSPQQIQMMQAQRSLYTPPSSAHGLPTAPPSSHGNPPQSAFDDTFFVNFQHQQQFNPMRQQLGGNGMYERDDTSSIGSGPGNRARSSSASNNGSIYGSPPHVSVSNPGSYEMPSPLSQFGGEYGVMRAGWSPSEVELGMMKQGLNGSISVGADGSGFGILV